MKTRQKLLMRRLVDIGIARAKRDGVMAGAKLMKAGGVPKNVMIRVLREAKKGSGHG